MEAAWLRRMRWRRRGAWLWPAFLGLTVLDAAVGTLLPPLGDGQSVVSAALVGAFANLFAIVALAWPVSLVLRRRRRDMPRVVARDYGGAYAQCGVAAVILAAGIVHHGALADSHQAELEAVARAAAYIGDRAPVSFRRNVAHVDSYAIEAGSIYRECVNDASGRAYCVVVRPRAPLQSSVTFAGSEPNALFFEGTQ